MIFVRQRRMEIAAAGRWTLRILAPFHSGDDPPEARTFLNTRQNQGS